MRALLLFCTVLFMVSCKDTNKSGEVENQNSGNQVEKVKDFREFKVLDSKFIDKDSLWKPFSAALKNFTEADYDRLKPFIVDQDIPTIQNNVIASKLSYEDLVKFYLYRIREFDRDNEKSLNAVISLNPNVIAEAKAKDEELKTMDVSPYFKHSVYGMPILLKDNIDAQNMPTTAGAIALKNNYATDAFIVNQLKTHGAIILGKTNLSEWAYFFCDGCPSGYSAIGGQTLNPYGRRIFDTGGSSSGSGVAVAANFCVAAVGSETSGSILSPSSQNSVVGLKPTIGLLSRSGIVPISSTLDTPGPMTKNVIDNAIVLEAMQGYDSSDTKSIKVNSSTKFFKALDTASLKGKRFGAFKTLMEDTLYVQAIQVIKSQGAEIIEIDPLSMDLPDFIRLLNLDMKTDLPEYLSKYAGDQVTVTSVQDVMVLNKADSILSMPYGQKLFEGIVADSATEQEFDDIKTVLKTNGRKFFDTPMIQNNLDGILSINNYHAGYAAVAEYPAITVPMGYTDEGKPEGLTFIGKPLTEKQLLNWAYGYEHNSKKRKSPDDY